MTDSTTYDFSLRRQPQPHRLGDGPILGEVVVATVEGAFALQAGLLEELEMSCSSALENVLPRRLITVRTVPNSCSSEKPGLTSPRSSGKEDSRKLETFQMEPCG